MNKDVFCPNCGLTVGEQFGGKLALAAAGLYFGGKVDPLLGLAVGLIGAWLGHTYIDSTIRTCPQCGTIIRIAEGLV